MRYWEDMELGSGGQSRETHTVTAEEIKRFAAEFDPLPFRKSILQFVSNKKVLNVVVMYTELEMKSWPIGQGRSA